VAFFEKIFRELQFLYEAGLINSSDRTYTVINLRGAFLEGADLQGASLSGANLQGADLSIAELSEGDLCGANLQGVLSLTQDQIQRVSGGDDTTLPEEIDRPNSWGVMTDEFQKRDK
jgi:hypothetical protein